MRKKSISTESRFKPTDWKGQEGELQVASILHRVMIIPKARALTIAPATVDASGKMGAAGAEVRIPLADMSEARQQAVCDALDAIMDHAAEAGLMMTGTNTDM